MSGRDIVHWGEKRAVLRRSNAALRRSNAAWALRVELNNFPGRASRIHSYGLSFMCKVFNELPIIAEKSIDAL